MARWRARAAVASLGGLLLGGPALAQTVEQKPLVELGVFGVGGTFPDYPGSAQNHIHGLPLPYIIYRGEYFQLAPNSVRGIIVNTDRVTFDVSASGAFQSSHNDAARAGMPGLDYMGQIGPRLNLLIAHDSDKAKLDVELPVRAVLSSNFKSFAYRGVVVAPEFAYTNDDFLGSGGRLKIGVGPEFATARLMDYFYAVAPQFVTASRPQFNATGGYLGSRAEVSYRYPLGDRATLFALVAPEIYSGATNDKSPLFKRQYGLSLALGFSYSVYASDARAQGAVEADAEPVSPPRSSMSGVPYEEPHPDSISTAPAYASAPQAERKIAPPEEPLSLLQPPVAAARVESLPPAPLSQQAAAPADLSPPAAPTTVASVPIAKPAAAPPVVPDRVEETATATPPKPSNAAVPEKDMSGWFDQTFTALGDNPGQQRFVMISDASGDPRNKAARICAEVGHVAVVLKTERARAANPDDDTIAWHFACRY